MTEHALPVAISVLGMAIVAQVADIPSTPGLPNILSSVGVVGALVWHMWFVSARLIPKMQRDFNDALDKMRQTFTEEQRALRAEHTRYIAEVREEYRRRMDPGHVPKKAAGE